MNCVANILGEVAVKGEIIEYPNSKERYKLVDYHAEDGEVELEGENGRSTYYLNALGNFNILSESRPTLVGKFGRPSMPMHGREAGYNIPCNVLVNLGVHLPNGKDFFVGDIVLVKVGSANIDFRLADCIPINDDDKGMPLLVVGVHYNSEGKLIVEFSAQLCGRIQSKHIRADASRLVDVVALDKEKAAKFIESKWNVVSDEALTGEELSDTSKTSLF